jgi:hypothetical protein
MVHAHPTTEELLARAQAAIQHGHEDLENFARMVDAVEKKRQEFDSQLPHWQVRHKTRRSPRTSHGKQAA